MWRARYARGRAIGEILMQQSMGLSRDKDEAQSRLHQNVSQSAGCSLQTGEKAVDKGQKKTRIRTGQMRMPKDPEADVVAACIANQTAFVGTASSIAAADSYVKGSSGAQANRRTIA
ncbi:hypothetical protein E4U14_001841 [Claviceps sp. LM454 group G7]|nr:hypothetical protein E4U14_001841 [Claviceps sp. LM454 group G7]